MKFKLLILLIISWSNYALGSNTDSLINLLSNSKTYEKTRLKLEIADLNYKINDSISLYYLESALDEKIIEDSIKVDLFYLKAKHYRKLGNTDSSEILFKDIIELCDKNNFIKRKIKAYSGYGNLERSVGNFDNSLQLFIKADSLASNIDDNNLKATILNNISIVYASNKDYKNSITIYKKLIKLENIDYRIYSAAYTNLSGIYSKILQYDSAVFYGLKAINLKELNHSNKGLAEAYNNLGATYIELNQLDTASIWVNKSLVTYQQQNSTGGIIKAYNNLARINLLQKRYNAATKYLKLADSLNLKQQFHYEAMHTQKYMYQLYAETQQWKNAFNHLQKYNQLNINEINESKAALIRELQTKYKTNILDKEKKLAQHNESITNLKLKNRNNLLTISIVVTFLIIVLLIYIYNRLRYIKKQKVELDKAYAQLEENKKTELIASNLKALQSQMNPHFIFNTLNSVQELVLFKDIRNSNKYLGKFSDLIRKILTSSRKQFINLYEEIEILQLYLDLEKLRFGDDLKIEFNCNVSEKKQEDINLPAMFIQPHVENAIKHGLFNKEGNKKLTVNFSLAENNYLKCVIEDNGIGQEMAQYFKQKNEHLYTGFTTEATNERIFLLNQSLDRKIDYQIEDLKDGNSSKGTRVTILFPI